MFIIFKNKSQNTRRSLNTLQLVYDGLGKNYTIKLTVLEQTEIILILLQKC